MEMRFARKVCARSEGFPVVNGRRFPWELPGSFRSLERAPLSDACPNNFLTGFTGERLRGPPSGLPFRCDKGPSFRKRAERLFQTRIGAAPCSRIIRGYPVAFEGTRDLPRDNAKDLTRIFLSFPRVCFGTEHKARFTSPDLAFNRRFVRQSKSRFSTSALINW
jgi:hypothetical protein